MTSPTTPRTGAFLITRRRGLGLLAATLPMGLLTACGDATSTSAPATTREATTGPTLTQRVTADEAALVALYDAALQVLSANDGPLRPLLETIRDQHAQHLAALNTDGVEVPQTPGPVSSDGVPVSALIEAELAAAKRRIRDCTEAQDPGLARLLAFMGASEASHVPALRSVT